MAELPIAVELVDKETGTVRFTVTCQSCGGRCSLTIADVPPFTRQVAQSLFSSAASSSTPARDRVSATCDRCERIAADARRDDRRDADRHRPRPV